MKLFKITHGEKKRFLEGESLENALTREGVTEKCRLELLEQRDRGEIVVEVFVPESAMNSLKEENKFLQKRGDLFRVKLDEERDLRTMAERERDARNEIIKKHIRAHISRTER